MPVTFRLRVAFVHFIAVVLCGLLVPVFAGTAELFRYRPPTKDGVPSSFFSFLGVLLVRSVLDTICWLVVMR